MLTEIRRLKNGSRCLYEMAKNVEQACVIETLRAEVDELQGVRDEKEADIEGLRTYIAKLENQNE